jgi:anti-sigma-K factor RskA
MSVHEQFAGDLTLLVLGELQDEQRSVLEKHLEGCGDCRQELAKLRGDMALLALSAAGPIPPARARKRLMDAVAREPRRVETPAGWSWWKPAPGLAAAVLALAAVLLWLQNSDLRRRIGGLQSESAEQQAELQRLREVVSTLTATDAMRVTLVAAKTPPQPQGKAMYVRDRSSLIFLANNLPALPALKAYELWLIPVSGGPIPAGVFKPDAHGSAAVINPPIPAGVEAKAFAITIEPEAGSSAPTSPIMLMGVGE